MTVKEAMVWIDALKRRVVDLRQQAPQPAYGRQMARLEALIARLEVDVNRFLVEKQLRTTVREGEVQEILSESEPSEPKALTVGTTAHSVIKANWAAKSGPGS